MSRARLIINGKAATSEPLRSRRAAIRGGDGMSRLAYWRA